MLVPSDSSSKMHTSSCRGCSHPSITVSHHAHHRKLLLLRPLKVHISPTSLSVPTDPNTLQHAHIIYPPFPHPLHLPTYSKVPHNDSPRPDIHHTSPPSTHAQHTDDVSSLFLPNNMLNAEPVWESCEKFNGHDDTDACTSMSALFH